MFSASAQSRGTYAEPVVQRGRVLVPSDAGLDVARVERERDEAVAVPARELVREHHDAVLALRVALVRVQPQPRGVAPAQRVVLYTRAAVVHDGRDANHASLGTGLVSRGQQGWEKEFREVRVAEDVLCVPCQMWSDGVRTRTMPNCAS